MGRVVHRDHVLPVVGPAFHVLRMGSLHVLDLAEFALVAELLDEKVFAAVHDGLRHHVLEPGFTDEADDLLRLFETRRHRHGAHDVLARLQRRDRLRRVIGDRAVDVDEVDVRIGEQLAEVGVAPGDLKPVADLVQPALRPLADRRDFGFRMRLIDGDELRTEAKPDQSHPRLVHVAFPRPASPPSSGSRMANLSTSRVGCPAASARIPGRLQSIFSPPRPPPAEVVRVQGRAPALRPAAAGLTNAPTDSQSRAFGEIKETAMFALERRGRCAIVAALAFGALQFAWPASAASAAAFCASGAGPRAPVPVPRELEAEVAKNIRHPDRDGARRRRRALRGNQTFGLRGRRQLELRQGECAPFAAGRERVLSRQPRCGRRSDGGNRPRHDLRLALRRSTRGRREDGRRRRS